MVAPDDLTPLASGFPQCGTADVEIMVPSVENPELLKVLSFKHGIGQNIKLHVRLMPGILSYKLLLLS